MAQLDKCLKFKAFQGIILYRVQSLLSSRKDSDYRHLSSCGTIMMWTPKVFHVRQIPAIDVIHVTDRLAVRQNPSKYFFIFFQHTSQSNFVTGFVCRLFS